MLTTNLLINLLLIILFSHHLNTNINIITNNLSTLTQNIPTQLPQLPNKIKQINQNINNLTQTLHKTQTLNNLIIKNTANNIITINHQNNITTINPTTKIITNYQHHKLIKQPYSILFNNTQFYNPILNTLKHNTKHITLKINFPNHNHTIKLNITTNHIHNTHNKIINALIIFSNLTAHKKTQHHITQTKHLTTLNKLITNITHKIHNPLTTIHNYIQILHQQTNNPIHQKYLSIILKKINSINKIIQQLLKFSHPHHNQ